MEIEIATAISSIQIASYLNGLAIRVHGEAAVDNFRALFPKIEYTRPEKVLESEAVLILTDWEEFEHLDYRGLTIIDGRGITKAKEAKIYEGICW